MYLNLKAEMARKSLNGAFMAKLINVETRTFHNKINGISDFTISEIKIICQYFDMTFEYLFAEIQSEKTA